MEKLKVFISSTYYDLSALRELLSKEIGIMGHDTILHEHHGIFYDPKEHTHVSCIDAVENDTDILLLIVGSRFGGESVPEVMQHINFEDLKKKSNFKEFLREGNKYSITQCECLKAIEKGIPIIPFVEESILDKRQMYEKIKKAGSLDLQKVPFFDNDKDNKHATYVFEFLKFLGHRYENNQIVSFKKMDDIVTYLKSYLSSYFKRLLKQSSLTKDEEFELIPQKFPAEKIVDYFFDDSNRKRSVQGVETRIEFDDSGHCTYEAKIKVTPIDTLTHYHYQIYSDKPGKVEVNEFRILEAPAGSEFFGIRKGPHLRLNLFFREPQTAEFTVSIKLKIENYISDLLEKGVGTLRRSITHGLKEISKIDEHLIFPDSDVYKNLAIKIIKHPEEKRENTKIKPSCINGRKEFRIRFSKSDRSTFRKNTQLDFFLKGVQKK